MITAAWPPAALACYDSHSWCGVTALKRARRRLAAGWPARLCALRAAGAVAAVQFLANQLRVSFPSALGVLGG